MTIKTIIQYAIVRQSLLLFALGTSLFSFSAPSFGQSHDDWCYPRSAARISITPTTDEIFFDFSKSEQELNNFKIDTVNPYGKEVIVDVGGLMAGGIELNHRANIGYITNPNYNLSCLWYDTLQIDIGIKPTIYIAKEYNKGTCMHNAIMEHEMKHIQVDIDMVNTYANKIGYEINKKLTEVPLYGPIPESETAGVQQQMMSSVTDIIKRYVEELKTARRAAQQKVDTKKEYDSVSAKCKRGTKKLKNRYR
jgi:hypothetical protein|tara:strand:- start:237215 stop:237967 length:753 start_codon:yes stop_codon:yes gene_type:complete